MNTSATPPPRGDHGADPWWGDAPDPTRVAELPTCDIQARRRPVAARGRRTSAGPLRRRSGIGWMLLGIAVAPSQWLARRAMRSARVRSLAIRAAVLLVIVTFLACSVGVILINNVVIGRTAELGELDDRRRELRRDNALLGATAAKLSAPPLVVRRAGRDLGMVRNPAMPKFVYLDQQHRTLTPGQKRRLRARNLRRQTQAAAKQERRAEASSVSADASEAGTTVGNGDAE